MDYKSPVYHVIAVPIEKIEPNTYNPNAVAPPEMKLLYESIRLDGYTMPIVCYYSKDEDVYILTTVTIPQGKVEEITINLKAPVIINLANNKGCQLIVEDDYPVKHKIYDILKNRNEKAGE